MTLGQSRGHFRHDLGDLGLLNRPMVALNCAIDIREQVPRQLMARCVFLLLAATALAFGSASCSSAAPLSSSEREDGFAVPDREPSARPASATHGSDGGIERPRSVLRIYGTLRQRLDPAADEVDRLYDELFPRLTMLTDDPANPVVPDLAASISARDTGRVHEIVLRRGLHFSDGTRLQAQDVKRSWERALNPRTQSPTASRALGPILGAAEFRQGRAAGLDGIEVVDARTLVVRLSQPRLDFAHLLALQAAAPTKLSEDGSNRILGAGPFAVVNQAVAGGGSHTVLARNPWYHGVAPRLEEIWLVSGTDVAAQSDAAAAAAGRLDLWNRDAVDIVSLVSPAGAVREGAHIEWAQPRGVGLMLLHPDEPPLDNLQLRKTLIAAAPVDEVFGEDAAYAVAWEGFPSYRPDLARSRHDPAHAGPAVSAIPEEVITRAIAGLRWCFTSYDEYFLYPLTELPQILGHWQDALGVRASETRAKDRVCPDDTHVTVLYMRPDVLDPYGLHASLMRAAGAESSDQPALKRWRELVDEAASAPDPARRLEAFGVAESYLHEHAIVLPLYWGQQTVSQLVAPHVRGYAPSAYGGSVYKDVWLAEVEP